MTYRPSSFSPVRSKSKHSVHNASLQQYKTPTTQAFSKTIFQQHNTFDNQSSLISNMHLTQASAACILLFIGLSSTIPLSKRDPPGHEFCEYGMNSPSELEAKRKMGVAPPPCNYDQLNRLGLDIPGNIKDKHDEEYKAKKIAEDSTWDLEHPEMDPEAQDPGADDFPPNDPFDGWFKTWGANPTAIINKRAVGPEATTTTGSVAVPTTTGNAVPTTTGNAAQRFQTEVVKVVQMNVDDAKDRVKEVAQKMNVDDVKGKAEEVAQKVNAHDAKEMVENYFEKEEEAREYKEMAEKKFNEYKHDAGEYKDVMAKWSAEKWWEMGLEGAQESFEQIKDMAEHEHERE